MNWTELAQKFYSDNDWAIETERWYGWQLRHFFAYLDENGIDLPALTPGQFTRHLNQMRRAGYSWSVRNGIYTAVAGYFRWLKANGHISENFFANEELKPARPRKSRRIIEIIAHQHLVSLAQAADAGDSLLNVRDAAIIRLLITAGLRRNESIFLRVADLDFEQNLILLRSGTKFGHERFGFIRPDLGPWLKRWLRVRPQTEHDYVFVSLVPNSGGGLYAQLRGDSINRIVNRLKKEARIPSNVRITPHLIRHTWATSVAKAGNSFALRDLAGHTEISTTEIYVHNDMAELRRVAEYGPKL